MYKYSNIEISDMHLFYGRSFGNSFAARQMYVETFTDRRLPDRKIFESVDRHLREFGQFKALKFDCGKGKTSKSLINAEIVLEAVERDPSTSIRSIEKENDIPRTNVFRILKEEQLHPYHVQLVQALEPKDFLVREDFCR